MVIFPGNTGILAVPVGIMILDKGPGTPPHQFNGSDQLALTPNQVPVALTANVTADEVSVPTEFVQIPLIRLPWCAALVVKLNKGLFAEGISDQLLPLFELICHCIVGTGLPAA